VGAMTGALLIAFVAGGGGAQGTPDRGDSPAAGVPCVSAVPVDTPCQGLLVPADEARRALQCLGVDLPECQRLAELDRQQAAADLKAAEEREAAQRDRADKLAALLQNVTKPPPPEPSGWRYAAAAAGLALAIAGGVAAGVTADHGADTIAPFSVTAGAGLVLFVVALADP